MPHLAYIGVGSNQGEKEENCRRAAREVSGIPETWVREVSALYVTEPWGPASEWYVNGVLGVETGLGPQDLLKHCQHVERKMGRRPAPVRWADRIIDLDILSFDDMILEGPDLILPHPELHRRRFVLVPLCEVAPDWKHPRLGLEVRDLLARVEDGRRVHGISPLRGA